MLLFVSVQKLDVQFFVCALDCFIDTLVKQSVSLSDDTNCGHKVKPCLDVAFISVA